MRECSGGEEGMSTKRRGRPSSVKEADRAMNKNGTARRCLRQDISNCPYRETIICHSIPCLFAIELELMNIRVK